MHLLLNLFNTKLEGLSAKQLCTKKDHMSCKLAAVDKALRAPVPEIYTRRLLEEYKALGGLGDDVSEACVAELAGENSVYKVGEARDM